MRDIDDLRHALAAETADLTMHIPAERIRRRARGLRARRATLVAAAAVLALGALGVPSVLLSDQSGGAGGSAAQVPGSPHCPTPSPGETASLGPFVETGAVLDAPNVNTQYDVLIGLIGTREHPGFVIAFRDRRTGAVEYWDTTGLARGPDGNLAGKLDGDPAHQFQSSQLALGPRSVLDVGVYSGTAHRITVASEGRAADARTALNAATGWTLFWVARTATPLPPGHDTTPDEYQGPERLTLTAYDSAGRPQHSVTGGQHVGHGVQNRRDHQPEDHTPPLTHALPTASQVC